MVTFGNEVMKIRKYYIILVYVLQGKMGKTKNGMKITQIKLPKYQKPIDENMGGTKRIKENLVMSIGIINELEKKCQSCLKTAKPLR